MKVQNNQSHVEIKQRDKQDDLHPFKLASNAEPSEVHEKKAYNSSPIRVFSLSSAKSNDHFILSHISPNMGQKINTLTHESTKNQAQKLTNFYQNKRRLDTD